MADPPKTVEDAPTGLPPDQPEEGPLGVPEADPDGKSGPGEDVMPGIPTKGEPPDAG